MHRQQQVRPWQTCSPLPGLLLLCTLACTPPAQAIAVAPAAAVSRAGIIYVSDSELGWQPVVASWLQTRHEKEAAALKPCFDKFVDPLFDFIRCAAA